MNDLKISRAFVKTLPSDAKNVSQLIHNHYEEIAKENIGSFEESIKDIRDNLNKYGLDLSIEY